MVEEGYGVSFSAAVTSAAGTLGPIIPPSICMVIYAVIAGNISIGALVAAGFLPGAITGLGFMIASYVIARRRNDPVHRVEITLRGLLRSLGDASSALVMPVFIIGALIFGVCTATEVGALACLYAVAIGIFVTKKLKWRDLIPVALRAGTITFAILVLISASYVASWFLAVHQVAQKIGDLMLLSPRADSIPPAHEYHFVGIPISLGHWSRHGPPGPHLTAHRQSLRIAPLPFRLHDELRPNHRIDHAPDGESSCLFVSACGRI